MAISKNISLNILAQVRDYQREMAKIPGITDKQAAVAARRLEKRLSGAQAKAAKSAQTAAGGAGKAWAVAGKAIAAAVSVEAIKRLFDLGQEVADLTNRFTQLSAQTGIGTDTLQAVDLAARRSGGSIDNLQSGLRGLAKRMQDASMGTGEAFGAFKRLGIEVTNADGSLRDTDAVFRESIASLQGIENKALAAAEASRIFGEEGGPLLRQQLASVNLEEAAAFVNKWGVNAEKAKEDAAAWQAGMANLGTVTDGMKAKVVAWLGVGDLLKNTTLAIVHVFGVLEAAVHVAGVELDTFAKVSSALMDGDPVGAIRAYRDGIEEFGNAILETARRTTAAGSAAIDYQIDLAKTTKEVNTATAAERRHQAAIEGLIASNEIAKQKAIKDYQERQKRKAAALRKWQAAQAKAAAEDAKRVAELVKRQEEAEKTLQALFDETAGVQLTDSQKVEQERLAQLARLDEAETELGTQRELRAQIDADAERKQTDIVREQQAARAEINAEALQLYLDQIHERKAAQKEAAKAATAAIAQQAEEALGIWQQATRKRIKGINKQRKAIRQAIRDEKNREGGARDFVLKAERDKLEGLKDRLRRQQNIAKGLAVAKILTDSAQGVVSLTAALAALGPGAPVAAAAIMAPVTTLELAQVRAQGTSFHTGTDEVQSTLLAGEAVLTRGGADRVGRENIAAANRGETPHQGMTRTEIVFRDRVIDTMVSKVAQAGGALGRLLPAPRMQLDPYGAI